MLYEERYDALVDQIEAEPNPIKKIRLKSELSVIEYALSWQGANPKELDPHELFQVNAQPLHDDATEDKYRARNTSPKAGIRAYCVWCQGGYVPGVRECESFTCPLHPFRMGQNPFRLFKLPPPTVNEIVEYDDTGEVIQDSELEGAFSEDEDDDNDDNDEGDVE